MATDKTEELDSAPAASKNEEAASSPLESLDTESSKQKNDGSKGGKSWADIMLELADNLEKQQGSWEHRFDQLKNAISDLMKDSPEGDKKNTQSEDNTSKNAQQNTGSDPFSGVGDMDELLNNPELNSDAPSNDMTSLSPKPQDNAKSSDSLDSAQSADFGSGSPMSSMTTDSMTPSSISSLNGSGGASGSSFDSLANSANGSGLSPDKAVEIVSENPEILAAL